jgi:parallel beta-helix repeat protein
MNGNQPRDFLRALDSPDSARKNEFHVNFKDTELSYNYFHAADSTKNYGSPSLNGQHMLFFPSDVADTTDRNHIDIYLNSPSDGGVWDIYPAHLDDPDKKEDLPLTGTCAEYFSNAVQSGAVLRGYRVASPNFFYIHPDSDATWYASGKAENTRINHESQHLFYSSRGYNANGFPNEMFSMTAEYLMGAHERDAERPVYNSVYDRPLPNPSIPDPKAVGLAFSHWYLWGMYLTQQFVGDTTNIYDDLFYKYIRQSNHGMAGLAQTLTDNAYASLGATATGSERLRNLAHNYSLAKWINNPSGSFYSGRYGFSRGVEPSKNPGLFDNSFNPCDKFSALEVPPLFVVGSERVGTDSTLSSHWCVTDANQWDTLTTTCSIPRTSCDTMGVWLYGADFIQFRADPYFNNSNGNTFHFRMTWNPSTYPGPQGNSLRVAAIAYPITSDSLYLRGQYASSVTDAFIDSLHGTCEVWVPNFGTSNKSVVIAIDLGEVTPGSDGRRFFYGYSFRVDVGGSAATSPIDLKAFHAAGTTVDSLKWSDPGNCGGTGYYIQRSYQTESSPVTFDSTAAGATARAYPASGDTLQYFRVIPKGAGGCFSNFATVGGHVRQSHSVSGVLYVSGDVTVDNGKTWTVSSGARVRVRPGFDSRQEGIDTQKTEITVKGKLTATGAAADSIRWSSDAVAPAAGDWKGIRLVDASDNSAISYNVIRHGYHGLYLENCAPNVDHCTVQHNSFYGLYAFGRKAVPLITNCVFEQNHGAELAFVNEASPTVRNCHLRYSPALSGGAVDDGAVFSGLGNGVIRQCRIEGVGMGVYCVTLSNPSFIGENGAAPFGRNDILQFRNYGVRTYDQSIPTLGLNDGPGLANHFQSGRNNIFSTTYPAAVFVLHTDPTHLRAQYCFWNGVATSDTTKFKGLIDDSNVLSTFDTAGGPGWYYPGYQTAPTLDTPSAALANAISKELVGDVEGAVDGYRELIATHPEDSAGSDALNRLLSLQIRRGLASSEVEFAAAIEARGSNPELRRTARRYSARLLAASGDASAALLRYAQLEQDPEIEKPGLLLEHATYRAKELGDPEGARAVLDELQASCEDRALLKHARGILGDAVGEYTWRDLPSWPTEDLAENSEARDELTLEQNVPNPMNPRTVVRFSLPRAGHAALRVFDIRGRLVRTLMDADAQAGLHVLEWDGRNGAGLVVASGVYYYRLEAARQKATRKLIVLK